MIVSSPSPEECKQITFTHASKLTDARHCAKCWENEAQWGNKHFNG